MNGTGFNGWLPVSGVSAAVRSSSLNELIDTVLIIQHRASQSLLTNYYLTKGFQCLVMMMSISRFMMMSGVSVWPWSPVSAQVGGHTVTSSMVSHPGPAAAQSNSRLGTVFTWEHSSLWSVNTRQTWEIFVKMDEKYLRENISWQNWEILQAVPPGAAFSNWSM